MAIKIAVEGDCDSVKEFVTAIRLTPQWSFFRGTKMMLDHGELREEYYVGKKQFYDRDICRVSMTSGDQQQIEFDLLDAEVIEMGDGVTYVHGKHFDIFAG